MYRSVYFDRNNIILNTWDKDGKRITIENTFQPYIYLETIDNRDPDAKSIFNTPLKKRVFNNGFERNKFVKDSKIGRIFYNIPPEQQYLIDTFWDKEMDYSQQLKSWFIDIETYSPNEFPVPDKANDVINVITWFDTLDEKFYTLGLGKLTSKPKLDSKYPIEYISFNSEHELLREFIRRLRDNPPDVISGWNSELFDIPYICNRIRRILGEEEVQKLSPINKKVYFREIMSNFGRTEQKWNITGIQTVDYLDIYKKFVYITHESYKLNYVANFELGKGKTDYGSETNLAKLSKDNWDLFIEYNIQDVNLLVELDAKLKFIDLLRTLSYTGFCNMQNALGTISVVTGACAAYAKKQNKIIPTFTNKEEFDSLPGGFVSEPVRGFANQVVSFDATSLYPSIVMSFNISPETKIGKIVSTTDDNIVFRHVNGKIFHFTKESFSKMIKQTNAALTGAGVLFSQKNQGVLPAMIEHYFNERVEVRKEIKNIKQNANYDKFLIERLDAKQMAIKILINGAYGYFANRYAHMTDIDIAKSITLSGQMIIKHARDVCNGWAKEKTGKDIDILKYTDTDSVYLSLQGILDKFSNNKIPTPELYSLLKDIEAYINKNVANIILKNNNVLKSYIKFKREVISDVGVFLEKKRYILHIIDDEGELVDKFKYKGVDVVRSTMPNTIKPMVKRICEELITTQDEVYINSLIQKCYDEFSTLSLEDISLVSSCNNYDKYAKDCHGFQPALKMPAQLKASYFYNKLLEIYNIQNKYESINSGDKIKHFYVRQPNKFGITNMGYKFQYPAEFNEDIEIDKSLMFEKIVYAAIVKITNSVGWQLKKPGKMVQTDLFDFFSS